MFSEFSRYRDQLLDYEADRLGRVDLMRARFAEQRFDFSEIAEDRFAFLLVLPEVVGRSRRDSAEQHFGGALSKTTASN